MGQQNGIDIFGGNSLGVADAWNQVRIGGALGGDNPGEALRKGSIAIFSNSGNFTHHDRARTCAWPAGARRRSSPAARTSTSTTPRRSSPSRSPTTRAARRRCSTVEPGGYYELDANFTKPVVACVVGRWKSKLTRAVGHAGAMAGGADDAPARNAGSWRSSASTALHAGQSGVLGEGRGRHQHRAHPGGADRGDARERDVARLRARRQPRAQAVVRLRRRARRCRRSSTCRWSRRSRRTTSRSRSSNQQIGGVFAASVVKDASGASQMDAKTQVSSLHGVSMLDAAHVFARSERLPRAAARARRRERREADQRRDRRRASICTERRSSRRRRPRARPATRRTRAGRGGEHRRAEPRSERRARPRSALIDRFARGRPDERARRELRHRADRRRRGTRAVRRATHATPSAEAMLAGLAGAWREVGVRPLAAEPRPAHPTRRRGAGRDHRDARLGTADAQAHLAADGREPALVDARCSAR